MPSAYGAMLDAQSTTSRLSNDEQTLLPVMWVKQEEVPVGGGALSPGIKPESLASNAASGAPLASSGTRVWLMPDPASRYCNTLGELFNVLRPKVASGAPMARSKTQSCAENTKNM